MPEPENPNLGIANPEWGCYGMGRNNYYMWEVHQGKGGSDAPDNLDVERDDQGEVKDKGTDHWKKIEHGFRKNYNLYYNKGNEQKFRKYTRWFNQYFEAFSKDHGDMPAYNNVRNLVSKAGGNEQKYWDDPKSLPSDADAGRIDFENDAPELVNRGEVNFIARGGNEDLGLGGDPAEYRTFSEVNKEFKKAIGTFGGGNGHNGNLKKTDMFQWPLLMTLSAHDGEYQVRFRNPSVYVNVSVTCFGKNTVIPLQNNKTVYIQDIKLGDVLEDGSIVTSTSKSLILQVLASNSR